MANPQQSIDPLSNEATQQDIIDKINEMIETINRDLLGIIE